MDDWILKHVSVFSTAVLALCYCYFISSRIPKGFFRLISLIPIFYLFTILPMHLPFPSVYFTSNFAFFFTWLANFKLLLLAFGQGPLSSARVSKSFHIFIASAALPIRTKPSDNPPSSQLSSKPTKKLPILNNLGAEIVTSAILIGVFIRYKEIFHPKLLLTGYCCLLFLLLDCIVAASSFLVRSLVGLELEPPSDGPYLSSSLQEFWGKRWNLTVTNILRETVYKPVRSASAALLGKELAPLPAVLASFVVSGLMHELMLWYAIRVKPSWEQMLFFVFHGFCVVLEFVMKKALNGRWSLPWFASGPLTVGFVILTSFWWFFPPWIRNRLDVMVLEEFRSFGEFVRNAITTHLVNFGQ